MPTATTGINQEGWFTASAPLPTVVEASQDSKYTSPSARSLTGPGIFLTRS